MSAAPPRGHVCLWASCLRCENELGKKTKRASRECSIQCEAGGRHGYLGVGTDNGARSDPCQNACWTAFTKSLKLKRKVDAVGYLVCFSDQAGRPKCPIDPFFIVPDKCKCVDYQVLKLQEIPESVPNGEMPRHMQLYCDRCVSST